MLNALESQREKLDILNLEFFKLLAKRKSLVHQIQVSKKTNFSFDPEREYHLFKSQSSILAELSEDELFLYSFMIESQAYNFNKSYPRWSQGVHLEKPLLDHMPWGLDRRLNPLLLALYSKKRYASLRLKESYKEILGPYSL